MDAEPHFAARVALLGAAWASIVNAQYSEDIDRAPLAKFRGASTAPAQTVYTIGGYVFFCRGLGKNMSAWALVWHGPSVVTGFEDNNVWVSHKGTLVKCSTRHLRPAQAEETIAFDAVLAPDGVQPSDPLLRQDLDGDAFLDLTSGADASEDPYVGAAAARGPELSGEAPSGRPAPSTPVASAKASPERNVRTRLAPSTPPGDAMDGVSASPSRPTGGAFRGAAVALARGRHAPVHAVAAPDAPAFAGTRTIG